MSSSVDTPAVRRWWDDPSTQAVVLFGLWVLTRLLLVVVTRDRGVYPFQDDPFDLATFPGWGQAFATGAGDVPLRDVPWEYPAGAAAVVVLPALLAGAPYQLGFIAEMAAFDAAVLLVLLLRGLRGGSLAGAALWCAAVPLLGPVVLARYDVVPTFFAVTGLIAASAAAPLSAGILLASGGAMKLWPGLLLPLVMVFAVQHAAKQWLLRVFAGAAAIGIGVVVLVAAYGGLPRLLAFLSYQRDRGLEIESLPALPLLIARVMGREGINVGFGFGSYQVEGAAGGLLEGLATLGLVAVVAVVAVTAARARRAGVDTAVALPALAVLLVSGILIFDKVLSAQYPVWIAGLTALSLCVPRSPLRPAVPLLLIVLALTQIVYPLTIQSLVRVETHAVVVLALRNLALVTFTAQVAAVCWRLPRIASDGT